MYTFPSKTPCAMIALAVTKKQLPAAEAPGPREPHGQDYSRRFLLHIVGGSVPDLDVESEYLQWRRNSTHSN